MAKTEADLALVISVENWAYNLDVASYTLSDLQVLYKLATGGETKSRSKKAIIQALQTHIYQVKYYADFKTGEV